MEVVQAEAAGVVAVVAVVAVIFIIIYYYYDYSNITAFRTFNINTNSYDWMHLVRMAVA